MDNAPDRYRYILERRVVDTPGAHWSYCGGATALLARIVAKGSGRTLHEFARENLFDPLGMGPTEWATGPDGEPFAASGARMSVRDLASIGVLMLHGGKVDERVVVPADWVTRCITPVISADEVRRYGYQWFVMDIAFGKPRGWATGAHVVGTGRRRSAAVCHPGTATRRRHHFRKLRKGRPGNTAGARSARGDPGKHPVIHPSANFATRRWHGT
jgi:CubicO group peptidase (beta-lactamase class C family)